MVGRWWCKLRCVRRAALRTLVGHHRLDCQLDPPFRQNRASDRRVSRPGFLVKLRELLYSPPCNGVDYTARHNY